MHATTAPLRCRYDTRTYYRDVDVVGTLSEQPTARDTFATPVNCFDAHGRLEAINPPYSALAPRMSIARRFLAEPRAWFVAWLGYWQEERRWCRMASLRTLHWM